MKRRTFVQMTAAALAPFVPWGAARGGDVGHTRVQRLIVLFPPDRTIYQSWKPTGGPTDFQLSPILAPLEPFKSKLVVVDGLTKKDQGGDHTRPGWRRPGPDRWSSAATSEPERRTRRCRTGSP